MGNLLEPSGLTAIFSWCTQRTSFSGNSKVRLSAIPDSDWQFDHWEGDITGSKSIVGLTINEDVHVTAVFVRIPVDMVKLEIVSVGHGVVDIVPDGEVVEDGLLYPEGTRTTLMADADSGWVFLGYYDESGVLLSEDEVTDLVLYDGYLIVAKFERLAPPPPPSFFDTEIVAADGQFLGYINDDPFDSEGLANPYGVYGDEFSVFSIWNPFSIYGSEFSDLSAYDPYAADPPGLYLDDVLIGYLTKNPDFFPQIDPDDVADAIGRYDVIRD